MRSAFTSFQKRKLKKVTGNFQEAVRLLAMAGRDSIEPTGSGFPKPLCDVADEVRRRNGQHGSKHPFPHVVGYTMRIGCSDKVLRLGCNGDQKRRAARLGRYKINGRNLNCGTWIGPCVLGQAHVLKWVLIRVCPNFSRRLQLSCVVDADGETAEVFTINNGDDALLPSA